MKELREIVDGELQKSDCARDSVQRSCLAAPPSDEPVTDEPPHLADRRLARIREDIQQAINVRRPELSATPASYYLSGVNKGVTEGLKLALKFIEREVAPAAEAREERPSGRPNANVQRSAGTAPNTVE